MINKKRVKLVKDPRLRYRINNCIATVLQIDSFMEKSCLNPELIEKLQFLEENLTSIDFDHVTKKHVWQMEEYTNELFSTVKLSVGQIHLEYPEDFALH